MYFRQFAHDTSGCLSYMIGCLTYPVVAVIDPQEDIRPYLDVAERKGQTITHVIETHVHADHRSGARRLAEATGALLYLHAVAPVTFPFVALQDGDTVDIGNAHLEVLHTPGHTPESICLLVADRARSSLPCLVLTGDTLFVGSVGRPDFGGDGAASRLFTSLATRLLPLDGAIEVFPAHFSGSACGAGLGPRPSSTIGYERLVNPLLSLDRAGFVKALHESAPARPPAFTTILRANRGEEQVPAEAV